jgi:hypothetical protein
MIQLAGPSGDLASEVRVTLFNIVAATGRVPQAPELARTLSLSETEVRAALRKLAAARALILAPNDGEIWVANPFCAVPSPFRVSALGRLYFGICIWDALEIAAALDAAADISAQCGDCGAPMRLRIRHGALAYSEGVVHFGVPAARWWDNIGFTCSTTLLFQSEAHVDRWCAAREMNRGAVISPDQAWRLARGWYRDKSKPFWRSPTVAETEALFDDVGLRGPFWNLRS